MRIKKFLVSLIICLITGISAFSISSCDQTEQPQDPSSGNEQTDGENNGGAEQKTEYTVTYNANGGVFADGNATMSAKTEKDAVLTAPASPQRTYYKFNGWSKNSSGTEIWNFATDTVTGDLTLYAVWKQESAVIFSVDGASIENKEIFMLVNHTVDSVSLANKIVCSDESVWKLYYDKLGQMEIPTKIAASSYGELDDGDNVFYIVVTSNDGTQVNVYELNVYRSYAVNVNYYDGNTLLKTETAYTGYEFTTTYTPNITGYTFNDWNYTARVLWDGLNLYADKTANTYKVTYDVNGGDELTTTEKTVTYDSDYTLTKPTKTGYTFLGWYYGSTQLTNSNGSSLESWGYASDKTATAKWQANEYTVTLNRNNTSAGTVTGAGDHAYDSNVTVTASTNAGYTWLGWYDKNDELVTIEYSYSFKMGFAVEYTAKWGKTTVTRNNTSAGTVTSLTGKYVNGQDVTVTATTNSGYTFLGWYNGETLLTTDTSYTFTMSSENVTYTAMWTYYTLTTDTNLSGAGTYTSCTNTKVTAGTETTLTANAYNGYTWLGWYNGETLLTNELSYTFEMPAESVTYTAKWTYYTVTTDTNLSGAGTYTTYTSWKITVGTETTLTASTNSGYTWLGWYNGETLLTSELSYTFEMSTENVAYTAMWTYYTLTTDTNLSGAGTYTSCTNTKVTAGTETTLTANAYNGYTWLGWYNGETLLTNELSYTFEMPAESVTYTAKWSKVAVTLTRNDTSAGSVSSLNGKYMYGQDVTVTATTNNGYTWLGWYNGDTLLTDELSYTFRMSEENVTYTAKWTYYTLTTDTNLSGAGTYTSCSNTKIAVGTETTLTADAYSGYTWLGWYNGEALLTSELSYTFTMPAEDVTYTSKWEIATAMQNFNFISTETTCSITGIKDKTVTKIVVPDYVTSISEGAFSGCSSLQSITLPFVGASKNATSSNSTTLLDISSERTPIRAVRLSHNIIPRAVTRRIIFQVC